MPRPFTSMAGASRRLELGQAGEDRAAAWYRSHGYAVVERNWQCSTGEIDLICTRGRTLIFVEVKARTTARRGHPFEAVTLAKQRRLHRLASAYLRTQTTHWAELRFDVVAVLGRDLEVLEGAF
jgi:putative endonuclease